ncbi:hypothetical protein ACJJTC_010582 [Scirpophaga incertulas]
MRMADKTVSVHTSVVHIETLTKWLSCNGEAWGVGPTAVFASAAALFLFEELHGTAMVGDHQRISLLEKTLLSTMVLGMLALMVHLWVCSMRFFQYYLVTVINESPHILLELTTAGLLGKETVPSNTLVQFLRQQQPQIHMTACWLLALCCADYVRKHYCRGFNTPYLELWQTELQACARRSVQRTVDWLNDFVGRVQQRLRTLTPPPELRTSEASTGVAKDAGAPHGVQFNACAASDLCVRVVSQSSETAVDAIAKLRAYISATRCTCSAPDTCIAGEEAAPAAARLPERPAFVLPEDRQAL